MSDILERAKGHFAAYRVLPVTVPEWLDDDGNPAEIFVKPLTLSAKRLLDRKHGDDTQGRMVTIIIRNLFDAEGKPIFTDADESALLSEVAGGPLERLALAAAGVNLDELIGIAEKN